jgi:outer membrane lipoprotein-sorting protein
MRLRLTLIAMLLCAGLWPSREAAAQIYPPPSPELQQIMANLQAVKTSRDRFVERKYLKMLTQPIESSGMLLYVAPNHLERNTLQPKPERIVVDGDTVSMVGGPDGQNRSIALSDFPQVGAIVEGIRATLAGDLLRLTHFYDVALQGNPRAWQLLLTPVDGKLRAMVQSIRISGHGDRLNAVETIEADGDRSVMTITPDSP